MERGNGQSHATEELRTYNTDPVDSFQRPQ